MSDGGLRSSARPTARRAPRVATSSRGQTVPDRDDGSVCRVYNQRSALLARQLDGDRDAAVMIVLGRHLAAERLDDALDVPQAEADGRSLVGRLRVGLAGGQEIMLE